MVTTYTTSKDEDLGGKTIQYGAKRLGCNYPLTIIDFEHATIYAEAGKVPSSPHNPRFSGANRSSSLTGEAHGIVRLLHTLIENDQHPVFRYVKSVAKGQVIVVFDNLVGAEARRGAWHLSVESALELRIAQLRWEARVLGWEVRSLWQGSHLDWKVYVPDTNSDVSTDTVPKGLNNRVDIDASLQQVFDSQEWCAAWGGWVIDQAFHKEEKLKNDVPLLNDSKWGGRWIGGLDRSGLPPVPYFLPPMMQRKQPLRVPNPLLLWTACVLATLPRIQVLKGIKDLRIVGISRITLVPRRCYTKGHSRGAFEGSSLG